MDIYDRLAIFTLGDWSVDPTLKQITRGDEVVKIDPRNMRVLQLLASRPGQLISQSEIEDIAWNGLVVTSNSVYQSIAQLRRALGEDKSSRRYIETISRKGYCLVAAVKSGVSTPDAVEISNTPEHASVPSKTIVRSDFSRPLAASISLAILFVAGLAFLNGNALRLNELLPWSVNALPRAAVQPEQQGVAVSRPVEENAQAMIRVRSSLSPTFQGDRVFLAAIQHYEQLLASQSERVGENDASLVLIYAQLARNYLNISNPRVGEAFARKGLAIVRQQRTEVSPEGIELNVRLAEALADTYRYEEAERHLVHAIDMAQQIHGDANETKVIAIHQLALLRIAQGQFLAAEDEARRAIAVYQRVPGASGARATLYRATLANVLVEQGHYKDAIAQSNKALKDTRPTDPPAPYCIALTYDALGGALRKEGRYMEAAKAFINEIDILETIPHAATDSARSVSALGEALLRQGDYREAEPLLTHAQHLLENRDGWRERKIRDQTVEALKQLRLAQTESQLNKQAMTH